MNEGNVRRYFRHGTLTQMRVFEAVARHANFTRAAEELHMAQPTVSVHMRKLTETVGIPLIEHVGKRMRITAAGEAVRESYRHVVDAFSTLDGKLTDLRALKAGKLRIATTTAGEYLLPRLLARFLERHADVEVAVSVTSRTDVLAAIGANAHDLYLLTSAPRTRGVEAHPILPNPLVAVASFDHPLARERSVAFERFAREPQLVREAGSGTRLAAERAFAAHGVAPAIRMELGSNQAVKEAVAAGLGVALLYQSGLRMDHDRERIAVLGVEGLCTDESWQFLHSTQKKLPAIAHAFVEFARREAPGLSGAQVRSVGEVSSSSMAASVFDLNSRA